MCEDNIDEDVLYILHNLVEQIDEENGCMNICDDCSIINYSVKQQKTKDSNIDLYLCSICSQKRHDDAQKVLQDLESLAHEVEQRLQAIENTERELDQWRDAQLQKNRDFWDEYRRQVENFSACRIRTLQYEYTIRQIKTKKIMKRLKRAKYIAENIQLFKDHLHKLLQPSLIDLLQSEKLIYQFNLFLSTNQDNSTITLEQRKDIYQQLEQLSYLDNLILPDHDLTFDEEYKDESDE